MRATGTTGAILMLMCFAAVSGRTLANQARGSPLNGSARLSITKLMEEALVPGVQIAVVENGRIGVQSFGVADVQSGRRVTENTVFEAASLGKPVLAYAVLRLASEGRMDLDKPIGTYLPDLRDGMEKLTARQLLSHTSGLPAKGRSGFSPSREPRFSYSGEGIDLLQQVVEQVTGRPLQNYMSGAVFRPLGMASSSFVWRDEYVSRKAFGHTYTGASAGRSRITKGKAASSLETTAGDYARFLIAAVQGRGLKPSIARQFLQPQVRLEEGCVVCIGQPPRKPSNLHWGLGIGLQRTGGRNYAWHWGDNETMQSYAAIEAGARRGVVVLTNSANGHSIAREIASNVLGFDAPGYAWVGAYGSYTDSDRRLLSKIVRSGAQSISRADLSLPPETIRVVAERLLKGGRATDAAALLSRSIAEGKVNAADEALLAESLRRAGRFREATAAANRALQLSPGDEAAKAAMLRIQQSQRIIPTALLSRYAGRYSTPFGTLEITSDGRRLTARLTDQPASEMLPLSDNEFFMESMGVPITFVTDKSGVLTHAIVRAGSDITLARQP